MKNILKLIENTYDFLAEEYAEEYFGEHEKKPLDETIRLSEYCGKEVDIDFMFFTTDFITQCLRRVGFKRMDVMERESRIRVWSIRAGGRMSLPGSLNNCIS